MAEALALVGLASSIVAFVDFSLKIIAAAKSVRDSGHGTLPRAHEIGVVLEDVRLSNLRVIQAAVQGGSLSEAERHIMAMATECARLEQELRGVVEKLKINGASRSRTIQSARLALRMYRKEKEIEELHRRILNLDGRIRSNVQMILDRRSGSETLSKLSALKRSQEELGIKYNSKLDRIHENILQLFESEQVRDGQLVALKEHLDSLVQESAVCQKQYRVIKSLYFPELLRRWSDITNADNFTNDWLFDSTKTNFLAWLKDGKGIYWISGKAGSGKSTLVKFAAKHDRTAAALKEWAGSAQLHTASFYFWNQGYEMQKSQIGLFQSLLYQILKQAPELAQPLCSDARLDHERWELGDLKKAFESIAARSGLSTKYCFFIDGLDEYNGDEETVLSFLSYFSDSKLADIKICVSSRPRALFRSFEQSANSLIVQHFTAEDMRTHVRARLQMNGKFNNLPKAGCEQIITAISRQSQGVWLWVYLVTRDLVHAVNRDEGLDTLREIVRQFPPDLEAYFEHVIKRIKPVHRVEMAQIFLIMTENDHPRQLFFFSMLGLENCDPDYAIKAPIRPFNRGEVLKTEEQWKARIQNRCGDLLVLKEVYASYILGNVRCTEVDFLHRTVRDFLRDCYSSQLKEIVAPLPNFDPLVSICRMLLFSIKAVDEGNIMSYLTNQLLYYAHEIENRSVEPVTAPCPIADLLNELVRVHSKHAVDISGGGTDDSQQRRSFDEVRFLSRALQARLVRYVRAKVVADPGLLQKQDPPPLDSALNPGGVFSYYGSHTPVDVDMVRLLLEHKADPNQKVYSSDGMTVWVLFLLSCVEKLTGRGPTAALRESWYQATALLCRYGADPQAQLSHINAPFTAESALEMIFGSDQTRQLQELMAEYRTRQLQGSMTEHHEPMAEHQESMDLANRGSWFPSLNIKRWLW